MKKIICIGECSLNIVLDKDGSPLGSMPGGRVANAAALLARDGLDVVMASEASADEVGDIIVSFLERSGADTHYIDRFTEGRTPVNIFTTSADGTRTITRYENYPEECFDIVWPRIDEGDIVLFGGFYAIDGRMHPRMLRLIQHAAERKAVIIYLPGFMPSQEPRITRVMPALLENLELADLVVARNNDLQTIFGVSEGQKCFDKHINFYCRSMINVDTAAKEICYYSGNEITSVKIPAGVCSSLLWNAGAVAGAVAAIFERNLTPADLDTPGAGIREAICGAAAGKALQTARALTAEWQKVS